MKVFHFKIQTVFDLFAHLPTLGINIYLQKLETKNMNKERKFVRIVGFHTLTKQYGLLNIQGAARQTSFNSFYI